MGWINTARYKWAEFTGNEIKFKPATFYLGIADHLAKAVEGLESDDTGAGKGRDHLGGTLNAMCQRIALIETNQSLVSEAGATTKLHPSKIPASRQPDTDGSGESTDPVLDLGPGHYDKVTDVSLSATLEVTTSTSTTHKPDSRIYPRQRDTSESKPKDPCPIPVRQTTKLRDDD